MFSSVSQAFGHDVCLIEQLREQFADSIGQAGLFLRDLVSVSYRFLVGQILSRCVELVHFHLLYIGKNCEDTLKVIPGFHQEHSLFEIFGICKSGHRYMSPLMGLFTHVHTGWSIP